MEERSETIWGGGTFLKVIKQGIKLALKEFSGKWDYFINLSLSDFPIEHPERLRSFLNALF